MSTTKSIKGKKAGLAPTQLFLPISEIRDSITVLKNGGLRAVLQVSSINFNLKSEDEQHALVYSYQSFLNTLDFPIQIVVRSKKLDIDYYVDSFETIAKNQEKPLLKKLTNEYVEYIKKLVEYADIMEKQFYVVIPYDPIRSRNRGMISVFLETIKPQDTASQIKQRHYEFDSLKKGLNPRLETVQTGLESCGLAVEQLNTPKLVELFYQSFNPLVSRNQKIENIEDETLLNI
jgi:type IV secretory pathway VirB4 component